MRRKSDWRGTGAWIGAWRKVRSPSCSRNGRRSPTRCACARAMVAAAPMLLSSAVPSARSTQSVAARQNVRSGSRAGRVIHKSRWSRANGYLLGVSASASSYQ